MSDRIPFTIDFGKHVMLISQFSQTCTEMDARDSRGMCYHVREEIRFLGSRADGREPRIFWSDYAVPSCKEVPSSALIKSEARHVERGAIC